MSAHSHNNLCEYLSFSQCCCFPVVGSVWFGSFFPRFWGRCVSWSVHPYFTLFTYIHLWTGRSTQHFGWVFFFCYYIAVVSFDLAWWFFLSFLRSLKSFLKVLLWKWVTLKKQRVDWCGRITEGGRVFLGQVLREHSAHHYWSGWTLISHGGEDVMVWKPKYAQRPRWRLLTKEVAACCKCWCWRCCLTLETPLHHNWKGCSHPKRTS